MKLMTTATVLAIVFATALSAEPKKHGNTAGSGQKQEQKSDDLGLSAEQRTKLDTLRKEHFTSQKALRAQLQTKQAELHALIKSGSATDQKIKEISEIQTKLLTDRVSHMTKVRSIMTPAQFEKFSQRQNMKKKGEKKGQGNGQGKNKGKGQKEDQEQD